MELVTQIYNKIIEKQQKIDDIYVKKAQTSKLTDLIKKYLRISNLMN
jgi:hypothetical protein